MLKIKIDIIQMNFSLTDKLFAFATIITPVTAITSMHNSHLKIPDKPIN